MDRLSPDGLLILFLATGIILAVARIFAEIAQRFGQPAVLGELLAGILLGPTILGRLAPETCQALFPQSGPVAVAFHGLTQIALVLFLLVAGMEVDLSAMWKKGKSAALVSTGGVLFPSIIGFGVAWYFPAVFGKAEEAPRLVFALFMATAMSISALPVIAKTLMDLGLFRSEVGMIVIASAVFDDLIGWVAFGLILGMSSLGEHQANVTRTIVLTLVFVLFVLTIGRWLVHRTLPWIQSHTSWPGGVLGFALSLSLFGAATTQWIGLHAVFGSFLIGVAIGDSDHLREQARTTIHQFISFIFAPLFFATIGLKTDFIAHFDPVLVAWVMLIACLGKVFGCGFGARLGGMNLRESAAVGFAMNARGAMEMILGLLALQHGLITEKVFVALVVMALATSMLAGPMLKRLLATRRE